MELNTRRPLIQVRHLAKSFRNGDQVLQVLKDISLDIYEGDFISVMGPSGSGKSTFINVLGFLDNHFQGEYLFQGKTVSERSDRQIAQLRNESVGFVFQSFNLIANMSVLQNVRLPLLYAGMSSSKAHQEVLRVLEKVGLKDKVNAKPHELSGGQRQRVAIARALVNHPKFIIADEPTGALDTKTSASIMDILANLHREDGVTIVMVTHDPSLQRYATRHVVMMDGTIHEVAQHEAEKLIQSFNLESEAVDDEDQ